VRTHLPLLRREGAASFSLLELLVVLAIAFGLVAALAEGYGMVVRAMAVTTGAAMIDDVLTEGRASAVGQNTTVEVRIYDVPPQPGAAPAYDALQLHWLRADGTTPPVMTATLLSPWVAIDATAAHSPLIADNNISPTTDATDTRLNAQTRVFHFLPDGSTDLSPLTNWFMTVRPASQGNPANFPANWACVRVDATTGRVQVYRP
jgi:uncharacterized protein (TIGR02596 family)